MKCNKCKSQKPLNKTTVKRMVWEDIHNKVLKSSSMDTVYLCNSCGAIQELDAGSHE